MEVFWQWVSNLTALEVYIGLAVVLAAIAFGAWKDSNRPRGAGDPDPHGPRSWGLRGHRSGAA